MSAPYRSGEERALGAVRSVHAQRRTLGGRLLMNGFFFGPALFLGYRALDAGAPIFDRAAPLAITLSMGVVFIALPLLGVVLSVRAVMHHADKVTVHEDGVVIDAGGRTSVVAGRAVSFGPLSLEPDALVVRGTRLPRRALESIELRAGVLYVMARGRSEPWAEQDVAAVANVHVLLGMTTTRDG